MISIIDPYMKAPEAECFNRVVNLLNMPCQVHYPSSTGMESFNREQKPRGIIVFGSAANVEDKLDWFKPLTDYLLFSLYEGIPVLGICFGHQLLAHMFGCKVGFIDHDQSKYLGLREVSVDHEGIGLPVGSVLSLAYSHCQHVYKISDQFVSIASSELFKNEILVHKYLPLMTTQAHPEADQSFLVNTSEILEIEEHALCYRSGDRLLKTWSKWL